MDKDVGVVYIGVFYFVGLGVCGDEVYVIDCALVYGGDPQNLGDDGNSTILYFEF